MRNATYGFKSVFGFFALLLAVQGGAQAEQAPAPQRLITENSERLVDALKTNGDAIHQDPSIAYDLVDEIVLPHIDFDRVARLVLGKYWRRATPEQRQQFTQEFRTFLIRTYVTAMVEFSDRIVSHAHNVRYLPMQGDPAQDDVTVRMEIRLPDRMPIQVNYSLYRGDDGWKIYDLTVEGVSLATTYRSSFATQIRQQGLEQLIARLVERNQKAVINTAHK